MSLLYCFSNMFAVLNNILLRFPVEMVAFLQELGVIELDVCDSEDSLYDKQENGQLVLLLISKFKCCRLTRILHKCCRKEQVVLSSIMHA